MWYRYQVSKKKHLPCEKAIQQMIYPCYYSTNTQSTKLWAHHPSAMFFSFTPPHPTKIKIYRRFTVLQQPQKKSNKSTNKSPQPTNCSVASPTRKTPIPRPRGKVRKANLRGRRLEEWFIHGNHRVDLNQKKGGKGMEMWLQFGGLLVFVGGFWRVDFNPVWDGWFRKVAFFSCQLKYAAQKIFEKRLNFNSSVGMTLQNDFHILAKRFIFLKEGPHLPTTTIRQHRHLCQHHHPRPPPTKRQHKKRQQLHPKIF